MTCPPTDDHRRTLHSATHLAAALRALGHEEQPNQLEEWVRSCRQSFLVLGLSGRQMAAVSGQTVIDVPETQHRNGEHGRLISIGRRIDTGERCTLLVIHEADGSWPFHAWAQPPG